MGRLEESLKDFPDETYWVNIFKVALYSGKSIYDKVLTPDFFDLLRLHVWEGNKNIFEARMRVNSELFRNDESKIFPFLVNRIRNRVGGRDLSIDTEHYSLYLPRPFSSGGIRIYDAIDNIIYYSKSDKQFRISRRNLETGKIENEAIWSDAMIAAAKFVHDNNAVNPKKLSSGLDEETRKEKKSEENLIQYLH
ncbi:hypothetical protein GOV05_04885 [Candidatus Woesearchaeota archaeon]|nr:hypothetical protein [Candidatus Woesearchaeota archaeon]